MTNLDEVVRYPAGITPHGAHHLLTGDKPMVSFHAADGTIEFRLLGGLAAPYCDPARAAVAVASLDSLLAPWQMITQKGATQHGVTTVGSLNDPIEINAEINLIGPDPQATMQLVRDWIDANDQMKPGELAVITHRLGRWWVDARWAKTPPNKILGALRQRQPFTQTWTVDSSLWRSYDVTDSFRLSYSGAVDDFDRVTTSGLGDDWTVDLSGDGGGSIYVDGRQVAFDDDDDDPVGEDGVDVVARRNDFVTEGDNQVAEIVIGDDFGTDWITARTVASQDIWLRMAETGTPGDNGVRLRIGWQKMRLSYFVSGTEVALREWIHYIPPVPGDRFRLAAGTDDNPRAFKVLHNDVEIQSLIEPTDGSHLGVGYRAAGLGVHVGPVASVIGRLPSGISRWSAGDSGAADSGAGFVKLTNIGDQPMWPRYTCFGPGTFRFANGPGSTEYVQFGPLLPNQIMQVRTDPELRPVVDMTSIPPTPQELNVWQKALQDFVSFASAGDIPPLLRQIESLFGIVPPQGHPYSLLSGGFGNPIPKKPAGRRATAHHIAVSISGGNADSMILAAGTPQRRYPL